MTTDGDRKLVLEDVILGFEVGSNDADDAVERRFRRGSGKDWIGEEHLREAGCGKSGFCRDIDG